MIDYYARIAPLLLPHLHERPVTRKRWPNGVESNAVLREEHPGRHAGLGAHPDVEATGQQDGDHEHLIFPFVDDLATLTWLANLAALELHVPQWTVGPRGGDPQARPAGHRPRPRARAPAWPSAPRSRSRCASGWPPTA